MRVPFGLDEHGNAVWADQIPYDRNGFKCGLVCPDPNCGKRLKAVRWSKDDPERGIHYLAHEANSRCAVESNPESLLHLEAKAVLKGLIGHDFYLPNLSLIDSVPHTSRYRNAGKLEFKKYGKLTVLPVPGSSVLKFSPETYKSFIPGTGCMTKIEDVKTERDCGAICPEGLIPDAVALLSHADTEIWVAIEFRVSHPKAIEECGNMPPWISRSWKYPSQMISQMRGIPERAWQNELQEPAMRRVSPVANGSTLLQLKRFSSVTGISRQNHPINRSAIKEQIS